MKDNQKECNEQKSSQNCKELYVSKKELELAEETEVDHFERTDEGLYNYKTDGVDSSH